MIRDMFQEMPIGSSFIFLIIFLLIFGFSDGIFSKPETFYGTVVDKQYKAERNSTGIGYATSTGGNGTVVVVSEHESEKFLVMVKTKSDEVVTVECPAEVYYQKQIGHKIECVANKGLFTGCVWSLHGIK